MGKSRYIFKLSFNPVKIESIIHRWLKLQGFKYIEKGKYRFFRAGYSKKNFTFLEYYFYKDELIIFAYVGSYKRPFPLENGMLYSNITVPYRMLLEDLFYCINNPLDTDKIFSKRKVVVSVRNNISENKKEIEQESKEEKDDKKVKDKKKEKNKEIISEDKGDFLEETLEEDSVEEKEKPLRKIFKRNKKEMTKGALKRRSVASIICFALGIINFIMALFGTIMNFLILVIIYIFGIYGLKSKKNKFSVIGLILLAISLLIMIIRYRL